MMVAALIVTGECRAETIADNNSKTMQYIPLNMFVASNTSLQCRRFLWTHEYQKRLNVAAMLDLQNASPLPLGCSFYSPQSSSSFKIQDGGCSVRSPQKIRLHCRLQ